MSDRATVDLILLYVVVTICGLLVVSTIGVIVVELAHPGTNTDPAIDAIGRVMSGLITAVTGYLAGMRHSRRNGDSR